MESKKDKIRKLKQELLVMKTLSLKPNYSELSRRYKIDRRTVKKYHEGYKGKSKTRKKSSILSKFKKEIEEKLNLPGATISGTYQYFKSKENIGTYSNFYKYVKNNKLKPQRNNKAHLRFETEYGKQLQFDWKEDIKMISKYGEIFEFNIFSATLGSSRLHVFLYSKNKTRIDVQRCLVETFQYIGGIPEEILTDNMSSIVDTKTHKFRKEFLAFANDMNTIAKKCKVRHPYTKGKDESANRFMSWLVPYNNEFEDEKELKEIIEKITQKVNRQVNSSTGTMPIMLYEKEKEYLKPLPNKKIIEQYLQKLIKVEIKNDSLFYYKGKRYSVPPKFINTTLEIEEVDNKLYVYYNRELITMHEKSEKNINYKEEHYVEGLAMSIQNKEQSEIEEIAKHNLEILENLN